MSWWPGQAIRDAVQSKLQAPAAPEAGASEGGAKEEAAEVKATHHC